MTDAELVSQVRAWIAENWDDAEKQGRNVGSMLAWKQLVHANGYAAPSWPEAFGGLGIAPELSEQVNREFVKVGAPGSGVDLTNIAANTLLQFGTEAAKEKLLSRFVTGEYEICLLYSEPGAGSDLAAVRTRADRKGYDFVINGQKVWTSLAMTADYGLLIARTDWDVPKHAGLSFLICPMKQAGVEVRPIHQINGESHFNEVFLDNVLVPVENLLSTEGSGWKVMQAALSYERRLMAEGASERRFDKLDGDNRADLVALARRYGKLGDPILRQEIAQAVAWRRLNEFNAQRAKTSAAGSEAMSLMSLGKLAMSRVLHNDASVLRRIIGPQSLLDGQDFPDAEDVNYRSLHAYMHSIGGGTDQIQRNIIGERVLGLPREIEVDRNVPFRESLSVKSANA